jgi:L-iditol 2-dehydrogenase
MSHALFLHGPRDARLAPFNLREGRPGEVLLDVAAVGLCGSDLHYYKDGGIGALQQIQQPFVPGHEFAGWLTEDVPRLGLSRGALVAVDPNGACGECEWCHQGHANLCPNVRFIGAPPNDGAMTGRIWVPEEQLVPLPKGMTPLEAAMLEPLGVAIHAADLAKPRLMETVTLLGAGPIGLLVLQTLRAAGAGAVHVVEPQPHRREMALAHGAALAAASLADLKEAQAEAGLDALGATLVVEATNSPDGFRDAVLAARIGGRVLLVGIPDGDVYTLPAAEARRRALKVKFARRMGEVYPRAITLVLEKRVDVNSMVTRRVGLADAATLFHEHAENAAGLVKSMIFPNGGGSEPSPGGLP